MLSRKLISLSVLCLVVTACAPEEFGLWQRKSRGAADFSRLLQRGKSPAGVPGQSGRGFGLRLSSAVVDSRVDPAAGYIEYMAFDTSVMPDVSGDLKAAALKLINEQRSSLGVRVEELRETSNFSITDGNGNVTLNFQRFVNGVFVDSSLVQVVFAPFKSNYRVRELYNKSYGDIDIPANQEIAVSDQVIQQQIGLDRLIDHGSEKVIFASVGADGLYKHSLATRYRLEDPDSGEMFTVTTKGQGDLLEAVSNRTHVAFQFAAMLYERSYVFNKPVEMPLSFATVNNMITDKDGKADVTPGTTYTLVLSSAQSRGNVAGAAANVQFATVANTTKLVLPVNATTQPALNAFVKTNVAAQFAGKYLTPQQSPIIGMSLPINVNINDFCNAFYDGSSLNFFRAGTPQGSTMNCANTATIDDVMQHEWGHALDDYTGPTRGITDGAYSEGIGDIHGAYINNSPILGPGFIQGSTNGLRNAENNKKYPGDLVNEVHDDGEIISATFWGMRKALIARYGAVKGAATAEKYFYNQLLTTDRYTQSYDKVLLLDDNDNNPQTRSPNFCLINAAFADHGLAVAANCVDAAMNFDESLKLALKNGASNSNSNFMISADSKSASVALCIGDTTACSASQKKDVEFSLDSTTADGIQLFRSKTALDLTEGMQVTILSFDSAGALRGASGVKITARSFN